jgi:hypothetical protein
MKRMACGTAATLALVGLAACFSNPANDLNNDNFHIVQATPVVMFTKVGDSIQLRLRLINDANNAALTSFTVTGVPAGISVRYDDKFRPYYLNGNDSLVVPVDKNIQQYYVKGVAPGTWTFTATATANTSASVSITVTVEAKNLGAALSPTTGLTAGDTVTINATPGLVFSQTSAVTFATGTAVVVNRKADSTQIKVLVGPGTSGVATVTKVGTAANPTIGVQTLATTNALATVPAVTTMPLSFSATTALTPVTVTSTGFVFKSNFTVKFGIRQAWTVSVASDGLSAVVVLPTGLSSATPVASGVALDFLASVSLNDVTGNTTATNAATTAWNGANPDATAPTITAAAAGTIVDFYDTGDINYGADLLDNGGPNKWYKLILPSAGTRTYSLGWTNTSDIDLYMTDLGINTAYVARFTTANPEVGSTNQPAGSYWIGISLYDGDYPGIVRIRIQ